MKPVCIHCGTAFDPTPQRPDFCCAGCQFVHDLIVNNGLSQFYELQDDAIHPVQSLVFQKRDYTWLRDLAKIAETDATASLALDLQGISCIGCVWLIEKLFSRKPGALAIEVNSSLGQLHLRWRSGEFDPLRFARELQSFGYLVGPPGVSVEAPGGSLIKRLGLCAAFAMNAMLFTLPGYLGMERTFEYFGLFNKLALVFGTLSFLVGGSYFFGRSLHSLRNGILHIDLPISIGLIAAYGGSIYAFLADAMSFVYFDFVSIFVFLMLVGRWLQQKAVEKNRARLLGLQTLVKPTAFALQPGERYTVEAGEIIPVRSKLCSAGATFGLGWINGESEAHVARAGQLVPSGAVNVSQSPAELEATETWKDSMLASLLQIVPRANLGRHGLERFIRIYIFVVMGIAAAGFGGWLFATGDLLKALQVLTSILVVSCPCAAGVALPLADELGVSTLRKLGVFVREQSLWARITRVRKIIFDKTGTLTLETRALRNPEALADLPPEHKRALLTLVEDNLHPVSCCLRELLLAQGVQSISTEKHLPQETVGYGLEMRIGVDVWRLGRTEWAARATNLLAASASASTTRGGAGHRPSVLRSTTSVFQPSCATQKSDCAFSRNGEIVAGFSFCDDVRTDAAAEVATLQARGYEVHIFSGDRAQKVASMGQALGIPTDRCHGEMSPGEKADWLRRIDDKDTLMIGDGANDSLAFDESYCNGTPAVDRGLLEHKADFYFLGRGLNGVRQLLDAGRKRHGSVQRVVTFALCYNVATIVVSLAGKMNPLAAAILMPVSSLVSLGIVFVSQRTKRI